MKLKEGSFVNIIGRYDEESWKDQTTHEKKSAPVLNVDDIEYCYSVVFSHGKAKSCVYSCSFFILCRLMPIRP